MKKLYVLWVSLFSVFFAFAQSNKEVEVWQRVELLNNTIFGTKDSMTLKDLVSEKVTYGHSGGNLEDKAAMVTKASLSPTTYNNAITGRGTIFFVNKTAVVRHTFRATSVDKGIETPLNLGVLQVWAKESGKWRIVARQAVKINSK